MSLGISYVDGLTGRYNGYEISLSRTDPEGGGTLRRRRFPVFLLAVLLSGCISPYTKVDQPDLHWYAQDRYRYAEAMPARDKEEAFKKIEAYWETIEAIRHLKDKETILVLDAEPMKRDAAREHVRKKIKRTEQIAKITVADYCGRAAVWTAMIPVSILKTPCDAAMIFVESPVTNIEW